MLITKFNKIIRSRWLWGGFAVLLSVSFVGYFSPGMKRSSARERHGEGQIYGKEIPSREFLFAQHAELGFQRNPDSSPDAYKQLRTNVWERLALLKTAENLGLSVSNRELAENITRHPAFSDGQGFNDRRYAQMIHSQFGVSEDIFEAFQRQNLLLQKLAAAISASVWVSPTEIRQTLENVTDVFSVDYVVINPTNTPVTVEISDEQARKLHDDNKELFTLPAKVSVRYVAFPISNYLSSAVVTPEEIGAYYDKHDDLYTVTDTNGQEVVQPLSAVSNDIAAILLPKRALALAKDAATDFTAVLSPGRYTRALGFDEAAASHHLAIATSAWLTLDEPLPGLDVGLDFNKAAFDLEKSDPERYFSDPVPGEHFVYVLAANDKIEARVQDFEEVADRVRALAQREAEEAALHEKAAQIRESIDQSLLAGKTFADAVQPFGLVVTSAAPFSAFSNISTNESDLLRVITPAVLSLEKGELTDVLDAPDGDLAIACVRNREPADLAARQGVEPGQVRNYIEQAVAGIVFDDFKRHLLSHAQLQDYADIPPEQDPEEDEEPRRDFPPDLL